MFQGNGKFGAGKKQPANIRSKPGGSIPKPAETAKDGAPKPKPAGAEGKPATVAHPVTGVHSVHVHHMGGGKAMTHTHHDGAEKPEELHHNSLEEAKQHQDEMLPNMGEAHQEPDGDEAGMMPHMSAIGGNDDGSQAA